MGNQTELDSVVRYLYPPQRAASETFKTIESLQQMETYLTTGDPEMDEYLHPFVPGDCCFYISRPGHSKTMNAIRLARANSELLKARGDNRVIVYFTTETTVPEFVALVSSARSGYSVRDIAKKIADMEKVRESIAHFSLGNVCVVGRDTESAKIGLLPDLNDLHAVLTYLTDQGTPPALVIVDYLQAIYNKSGEDRQNHSRNTMFCKELALIHNTVFWVAAQAGRQVDTYSGLQLPRLSDGQWTSTIEQAGDKVFSATRPSLYLDSDDMYELTKNGAEYEMTKNSLVNWVLKCRFSDAGRKFAYEFDWPTQTMLPASPVTVPF